MSYLSTILADHPVHYWRLTDGLPNIAHDIGSSPQHLAIQNNSVCGMTGIANDGGGISVQPGAAVLSTNDLVTQAFPFTIECWYWALRMSAGSGGSHVLIGWPAGGATSLAMGMNTSRQFTLQTTGGFSQTSVAKPYQAWHHVVGVFGALQAQLYVDGSAVAAPAAHGLTSPWSQRLGLGADSANSASSSGVLTECAIYPVALSNVQVQTHFLAQESSATPVSQGIVTSDPGTGAISGLFADLNLILQSVRKVY